MTRGFSLVEIAIVLVVVGLVISGGLLGISPVLQANKVTQTNQQMDKIQQALVLYVIQNGCLPCPAVPGGANPAGLAAFGTTATVYGPGQANTAGCQSGACTETQGLVPWVNLGLSKADVIDAFGSFIDYAPATGLNTTSTSVVRSPPSYYPSPTTPFLAVSDASGNSQVTEAAYVLISHGPDGSGGFSSSNGTKRADPHSSALQTKNTATGAGPYTATDSFVQDTPKSLTFTSSITGCTTSCYFDDIVRFVTVPNIIQSCGSNACGNPA